jgi:hypothetical protein
MLSGISTGRSGVPSGWGIISRNISQAVSELLLACLSVGESLAVKLLLGELLLACLSVGESLAVKSLPGEALLLREVWLLSYCNACLFVGELLLPGELSELLLVGEVL